MRLPCSSGTVIMLIQSYGYTLELQYVIHQFTYKQLFIIGQKRQFIVSTGFPVIFHPSEYSFYDPIIHKSYLGFLSCRINTFVIYCCLVSIKSV